MTQTVDRPVKFGELGFITFARTYSREKKNGQKETFSETVERELRGICKQLKLCFSEEEKEYYRFMRHEMKGSVAGRFMWQLGTKTVDRLGLASLQNCSFTVIDSPVEPFTWTMDMLMLGSGVGYSIKKEHVYKLPKVKRKKIKIERWDDKQADFIVPDTREGWVKLLGKVLKAYFFSGEGFTYSTQLIRGRGESIEGFGGVASGPTSLVEGIDLISGVLDVRRGKQLRPIDCLDIMNIIGMIVVAGNVRRSAQIAIGDYDDLAFLKAKRWDLGSIPNWRSMSNNSVDCEDAKLLPKEFWDTYEQGEPYGLINLNLSRTVGRLGETQYPDMEVEGFNPSLRSGTRVWTTEGIVPIEQLEGREFLVRNLNGDISKAKCWMSNPNATLYKITLQGGHEYYCTKEHKWPIYTDQGWVKCETTDLKPGHLLPINKHNSFGFGNKGDYSDGFFIGWLYGDGGIHIRKDTGSRQLNLIVSKKDDLSGISHRLLDKLNSLKTESSKWRERRGNKELSCQSSEVFEYLDSFGVDTNCEKLPTSIWNIASEDFRKGFVDGIFSSDGGVESTYKSAKVRLVSSKSVLIEEVSQMLGFYGIKNNVNRIDSHLNGKVFDRYTLTINTRENISHFRDLFKLSVKHKQESLNNISKAKAKPMWGSVYKVLSVEETDTTEPVWDITVFDDTHCFQLSHVITGNCAEQSLADKETCCLAEIYLPNIESFEELKKVASMLYKINKHSLALKCHQKSTEDIVHKNMRMGIGITGVMMSSDEQLSWLAPTYEYLRQLDKEYSKENGFNESIKLTTVKPSGTLSLLAGVTPGVHPATAGQYYIRRIRMSSSSKLVDLCKANGYHVEFQENFDGTLDKTTYVVEFPCKYPDGVVSAEEVSLIEQLEMVKFMQKNWSDNSVSVTAYYTKEELPELKKYIEDNFADNFKTLSFLLKMNNSGFKQLPYEAISKAQYEYLSSLVKPITDYNIDEDDLEELGACGIGGCPIK